MLLNIDQAKQEKREKLNKNIKNIPMYCYLNFEGEFHPKTIARDMLRAKHLDHFILHTNIKQTAHGQFFFITT